MLGRHDIDRIGRLEAARADAWAAQRASYLPESWRPRVLAEHRERRAEHERDGNTWLRELADEMRQGGALGLDATDEEIRTHARDMAASLYEVAATYPLRTLSGIRQGVEEACRAQGITPPAADVPDVGALARMFQSDWWVRRLRAAHGRRIERHAIGLGYVHKRAGCYVSDVNLKRRAEQRERSARIMESVALVNQHGDEFELAELAERSNANPTIRRAELMTRIAGFEAAAKSIGHAAEFWTGTAPSRFHAVHWGGGRNTRHDGSTPRDAQAHLVACWARCRAAMQRRGIRPYGFRIAEPHHDGCPHWHLLLFMPAEQVEDARALFRRYFLEQHEPHEPGARENRVKFVAIDPRRGSAAGYVAKYVAKNIDGYSLGTDLYGNDEITTAARVDAWAATWGIRQFQQIGGAPVGVWRELRRIEADARMGPTADAARDAADAGDWARYLDVMGGPMVERKNLPLRVAYTARGEKFCPVENMPYESQNMYGEPAAPSVYGVEDQFGARYLSRRFRWEVKRGRVSGRAQRGPWTRVNNCTDGRGGEGRKGGVGGHGNGSRYSASGAVCDADAQKGGRGGGIRGGGGGVGGDQRSAVGDFGGSCALGGRESWRMR